MFLVIEIFQARGISKYFLTGLKEHTVLVVFDFSHTFFTLVLPSVFTVLGATPHTRQVTPLQSVGVIIFVSTPEMCLIYDKFNLSISLCITYRTLLNGTGKICEISFDVIHLMHHA